MWIAATAQQSRATPHRTLRNLLLFRRCSTQAVPPVRTCRCHCEYSSAGSRFGLYWQLRHITAKGRSHLTGSRKTLQIRSSNAHYFCPICSLHGKWTLRTSGSQNALRFTAANLYVYFFFFVICSRTLLTKYLPLLATTPPSNAWI